jgi:large subunit ribosomal protein L21
MYAVVVSGGKQYRVSQGDTLVVDRLAAEVGSTVSLDQVLLVGGEGDLKVGSPILEGANVSAEVISHDLGDKCETFKYRRRHRSRVLRGSRARLTTLSIQQISA